MYKTDSKNIGMAGISEAEYRQFLKDLESLNNQYNDIFRADERQATQSFVDAAEFPGQTPQNFTTGIGPSQSTQDAYTKDFYGLVNDYGINPVVEGSDKVYYLDPGMPGVNPYGPDAKFNDPSGTRPGMYTRDARTTGQFNWGDALKDLGLSLATGGLSNIIGGADRLGGLIPIPGLLDALGAYKAGSDSHYGVNTPGIMEFANSQGDPASNSVQELDPVLGEGLLDWIGEQIQNTPDNAINIPIPGLPFPIPGNMSITDLWEIAKRTGKSIQQVIQEMGNQPTSGAPVEDDEEENWSIPLPEEGQVDVGVESPGESETTNRPGLIPEEQDKPAPGESETVTRPTVVPGESETVTRPTVVPGESETVTRPTVVPGEGTQNDRPGINDGPGEQDNRPGFNAALLGLLPFLSPDPEPQQPGEYDLWDYIGADGSYGIQRPDYGTPQMSPLYDFPNQPNQPVGVDYNPMPRNDFINPVEAERRRRGLL